MSQKLHHAVLRRIFKARSQKHGPPPLYQKEAVRNILIVNTTAIGDTLLSTPSIRAIRKGFGKARITALVSKSAYSILSGSPYIDSFIMHPGRVNLRYLLKLPCLIKDLKKGSFDLVIVLHANDPDAGPIAFITGASWSMGFKESGFSFLFTMPVTTRYSSRHVIDVQLENIGGLGIRPNGRAMDIFLTDRDFEEAGPYLEGLKGGKGFVCLHPFGSNANRWWPEKNAVEFLKLLGNDRSMDMKAVVIGGVKEREYGERIAASGNALSIAGRLSIRGAAALIKEARAVISTDSGPMHIAEALKTPCIALFGPANPLGTGPLNKGDIVIQKAVDCAPCLKKQCQYPRVECMEAIGAEEVFNALEKRLCG